MTEEEVAFYKSDKWLKLRKSILLRDKYQCQNCKAKGKLTQAVHVHHIFPREQYDAYQWESWNLTSLCMQCHNEMHNRFTNKLSKKGEQLMRVLAASKGIDIKGGRQTILVVGLRGTGKSTYVKNNLDVDSIAYDLDAIASAFRLKMPHEEHFMPARKMANDFLQGFLIKAHDYCDKVYVIRTAPTIKEFEQIAPDKVVFCMKEKVHRSMDNRHEAMQRINAIKDYCDAQGIETLII